MAKYVSVDELKSILNGVISEEAESSVIETIMEKSVDYDDEAIEGRISAAADAARGEAQAEYSKKLHDMFFGTAEAKEAVVEAADETKVVPEITGEPEAVEDIFDVIQ